LTEKVVRGLFHQALQAVQHCSSCGILHCDTESENIILDLGTGEAKLISFGCGTFLKDTVYTQFSGTLVFSSPEWMLFHCYHGHLAMIWSLGIL
ncbi:PIM1 kinase, partial [Smithornis capensis]|nr:PIM1 kinase [Smithornis capensis]